MNTTRFPSTASGVTERVAGFIAHLRYNGYHAGVAETDATLNALRSVDIEQHSQVRLACKAVCASNKESFDQFDELFDSYWFNRGREKPGSSSTRQSSDKQKSRYQPGVDESQSTASTGSAEQPDSSDEDGEAMHNGEGRLIASRTGNLNKTDFREMVTPELLQQAEVLACRLAKAMRDRRSRRYRLSQRGNRLNLRKTIRKSVSHGGVPIQLYRQHRPDRPVKIVTLLDVSGSMTVYARVFLAFLKGLISNDTRADAYLFHTALMRIGETLRDHDTLRAMNRLSTMAQGFGGGTKIGANLKLFNEQYASTCVDARTVVIMLSDGYDTDPPEMLAEGLQKLKKRNCKIIWLNPLKGWKDYAPVAQGMAAALPWLDHFAAANTLDSLAALEPALQRL